MSGAAGRVRRRAGRLRRRIREPIAVVGTGLLVEFGLRRWPLPRLAERLGIELRLDGTPAAAQGAFLPVWSFEAIRATERMFRWWPLGDTCLRRCLVLGHRLRRRRPVLRIGIRAADSPGVPLAAHAWLEIGGGTLDPAAADYQTLARNLAAP